ncbi:unnamed protein product, partial [Urochloa humidicola]
CDFPRPEGSLHQLGFLGPAATPATLLTPAASKPTAVVMVLCRLASHLPGPARNCRRGMAEAAQQVGSPNLISDAAPI